MKKGDPLYIFDNARMEPVRVIYDRTNDDGWIRVHNPDFTGNSFPEWFADVPHKFYLTRKNCILNQIERLTEKLTADEYRDFS